MKIKLSLLAIFLIVYSVVFAQSKTSVSRDWTSFSQSIEITSNTEKKFKVIGSVKVIATEKVSWAGIWARVDNKDEETGFFDNMGDRPIKSDIWETYTVEGKIDSNSKTLRFGGLSVYNGQFYFDDLKLFIENNKGDYELVEVENSSFESKITKGVIPKWNQGISEKIVRVKEFKISQSKDQCHGDFSLLIEGSGINTAPRAIGNSKESSPQIASMISMLEDLKHRVEKAVENLSQYELDHLHDEKANRIGALVMHLAAAEAYYQVFTFEGRGFNDEEKKKWDAALNLDQAGRDKFKGKNVQYYLDIYNKVREKTISELKKRDDKWFEEVQMTYNWTNQYCWFHVMEHQSSHLGQILFLKKRIPPEEVKLEGADKIID